MPTSSSMSGMHITWHGEYTIKIVAGETTLVLDPNGSFRAKANVVSLTSPGDDQLSNTSGIQGDPLIISHPGEYSLSGMTLHAIGWHNETGSEHTVQRWDVEKMVLLHIGKLNRGLSDAELSELERTAVDILFLPVDGTNLPLKTAIDILTKIEPRIVIPINFTSITAFAQEMGVSPSEGEVKFIAKASKLPTEEMQTVILKP